MRIDTHSGLHGALVAFVSTDPGRLYRTGLHGWAIVLRDQTPFEDRPYSTHLLYTDPDGNQYAESGRYDLTYLEAYRHFAEHLPTPSFEDDYESRPGPVSIGLSTRKDRA